MSQRIFIAHILEESSIVKQHLSAAGCNFSFNLISGNTFDRVYSIMPTNVGGALPEKVYEDSRYKLIYTTWLRSLGKMGILTALFWEQLRLFFYIKKSSSVWTYNLTSLNVLLILLLKWLKRSVKLNVIVLDYTPTRNKFTAQRFYLWVINHVHGNIRVADNKMFTCDNSALLAGVVSAEDGNNSQMMEYSNRFMLSGVLSEAISQTEMVLKSFSELPECELHITGFCQNDEVIKEYASRFPNIIYHGKVEYKDYLQLLHESTYVLSTRNHNYPENKCNFPSKIIESLLHNRIIISTMHYQQLEGINYFEIKSDAKAFKEGIKEILDNPDKGKYANQGYKIRERFNTDVWKTSIERIENAL